MYEALTVVGTVGSDPQARATPTGRNVTSFRLASTSRIQDPQTGQWRDGDTNWFTVSAWNELGRNVHDSIRKGERVVVSGKLKVRQWETDERRGTEVELVAGSVGHDLKWGTTRFTRVAKAAEDRSDEQGGADEAAGEEGGTEQPAASGGDDWSASPASDPGTPF